MSYLSEIGKFIAKDLILFGIAYFIAKILFFGFIEYISKGKFEFDKKAMTEFILISSMGLFYYFIFNF